MLESLGFVSGRHTVPSRVGFPKRAAPLKLAPQAVDSLVSAPYPVTGWAVRGIASGVDIYLITVKSESAYLVSWNSRLQEETFGPEPAL